MNQSEFQQLIEQKGHELCRDMPWRQDTRPYYVLVSELMLQQTQVERVIPKFEAFITAFPDEQALAAASLADVLVLWQGLGYNRRAKFLWQAACKIVNDFQGEFPSSYDQLVSLPGVGPNTAGAILNYAYNQPTVFIETNVRTVYFHHFFAHQDKVSDKQLREVVQATMDHERPREFYWALMDYGSFLKRQGVRNIKMSHHYKKQSPLEGSVRQVRGQIIRRLAVENMTETKLRQALVADERFDKALSGLVADGLVTATRGQLHLTK